MEQLEAAIDRQSTAIGELKTLAALLQQSMNRIESDVKDASIERRKIQSELGAYGIQLSAFVAKIDALQTSVNKLEPTVQSLQTDRTLVIGAGRAAGLAMPFVNKILWGIFAAAGTAAAYIAGVWSAKPNP